MAMPIAILLSGGGSNLQAFIDCIEQGKLDAEIKVVISNKADANGLARAKEYGIPCEVVSHNDYPTREDFDARLVEIIRGTGIDADTGCVVLAGFMRILTDVFVGAFSGRIINIHPALLPSFTGADGQGDADTYGVKLAGCSVHFVTLEMDSGPIIIQGAVPAYPTDDRDALAKRILAVEHRIFPQAVQWFAHDRLSLMGRKVYLEPIGLELAPPTQGVLVNPPLEEGF
ncbi:MAG: phosphoribosylglycinamide formyltransferase [Desulfovibrio sp.]